MPKLLAIVCFAVFMLALGAQVMLVLERGALVALTLGQSLALFYVPDPIAASKAIDDALNQTGGFALVLRVPAVIAFGALWLSMRALAGRKAA